jgi:hypothetical protein
MRTYPPTAVSTPEGCVEAEIATGSREVVQGALLGRTPLRTFVVGECATRSVGLRRVRGRQFRYCHFLCSHAVRKRLLRESPFRWGQGYPKKQDCVWVFEGAAEGSRESREPPRFQGSGQFRHAAPLFAQTEAEETPERTAPGRQEEAG